MPPDSPPVDHATVEPRRTSPLLVVFAWLVVGVPAAWGVSQTVMRSLDLFRPPPPPASPPATR